MILQYINNTNLLSVENKIHLRIIRKYIPIPESVMKNTDQKTIVIGVIGADCHAVGNKILTSVLGRLGFNVINLGVMVSQDEFIDTAIETGAKAILVSSIYGHGEIDCIGFRGRCIERGLNKMVLYVGGNLVIGKHAFDEVEKQFIDMGFDRVFPPSIDLNDVAKFLHEDIGITEPDCSSTASDNRDIKKKPLSA